MCVSQSDSLMTKSTTAQKILFPSDRNDQSTNESNIMSDWKELEKWELRWDIFMCEQVFSDLEDL